MRKLGFVFLSAAAVLTAAVLIRVARADDFVWTGAKDKNWNDKANWNVVVNKKQAAAPRFPDKVGDLVAFPKGGSADLSAAVTLNRLGFVNGAAGKGATKGFAVSGQTLIFDSGDGSASVVTATKNKNSIGSDIKFDKNNLQFEVQGANATRQGQITVTGVISSADPKFSLIKSGDSLLILSAKNTYGGNTLVNAGELKVTTDGALGVAGANLTVPGGTQVSRGAMLSLDSVAYTSKEPVLLAVGSTLRGYGKSSFDGPITLRTTGTPGSETAINVFNGNDVLQLNGPISQSIGGATSLRLVKTGNGTLVLNVANTFDSSLVIRDSVVQVNVNNALGTTTGNTFIGDAQAKSQSGTRLDFNNVQYTTKETIQVNGTGDRGLAINNIAGKSLFAGPIELSVNAGAGGPNADFGAVKDSELTLSGVIRELGKGQKLSKVDAGIIILSGANTYTGGTEVKAGTLVAQNNGALGTPAASASSQVDVGAMLSLRGGITLDNQKLSIRGYYGIKGQGALFNETLNNTLGPKAPVVLASNGNSPESVSVGAATGTQLTIRGVVSEGKMAATLAKVGEGTLVLSGANTYTGGTAITAGTLIAEKSAALGAPGKDFQTDVAKGATLGVRGRITLDNQRVQIAGDGVDGKGAIYNLADDNTFGKNAPVKLLDNSSIGAADKTNLKFEGTVDKNGNNLELKPGNGAKITFEDQATNQAIKGMKDVIVDGPGRVVIASGSTYDGPTFVRGGSLQVSNTIGSATGTGVVTVNAGATLLGTGIITGSARLDAGALLHPGTEVPGILHTLGGVSLGAGSTFEVLLGGPTAGEGTGFHSQLQVLGGTSLDQSILDVLLTAPPVHHNEYDILRNLDNMPVSGRFEGLPEGTIFDVSSPFGTYEFLITYFGGDDIYHDGSHNDVVLTEVGVVTPEPPSLVLAGLLALSALALHRLRGKGTDHSILSNRA